MNAVPSSTQPVAANPVSVPKSKNYWLMTPLRERSGRRRLPEKPARPAHGANAAESSLRRDREASGLPAHIGRYRILRRHGEGGMGTVYEAEQDNPRRTVALKVITRPVSSHPSSSAASDTKHKSWAGSSMLGSRRSMKRGVGEDGQPFFAMEFIRGMPLDEYAAQSRSGRGGAPGAAGAGVRRGATRPRQGRHSSRLEARQHPGR